MTRRLLYSGALLAALFTTAVFSVASPPVRRTLAQYHLVRAAYWRMLAFVPQRTAPIPAFTAGLRMTPDLPQVYLDTAYTPSPCTKTVASGGDFQRAIDSSKAGDTICLAAGARFTGHFILRKKAAGEGWIVIRAETPDSGLAPAGSRISPDAASRMPLIVTPDIEPALATESEAHHYRLIGLNISGTSEDRRGTLYSIVHLGLEEKTLAELPHDIIIDRCYIHGLPEVNVRRGVTMNAARIAVIDSYISGVHDRNSDSQAIECWNGPGPFKIQNNYLEGAGENVMFGGGAPQIPGLVPADIEIRRNYFFKPLEWKQRSGDERYVVKNLFEIKNARRVLLDGNIFENSWVSSQDGTALVFNGVDGPASLVEDVTLTHNIVRGVVQGITGTAHSNGPQLRPTNTILIRDNLFTRLQGGNALNLYAPLANITVDHNTVLEEDGSFMSCGDYSPTAFADHYVITNNIVNFGRYGIVGLGPQQSPIRNVTISDNAFIARPDGWAAVYAPYRRNYFPVTAKDVRFEGTDDYHLSQKSPYHGKGSDGKDLGADMDALSAAAGGAETGQPGPAGSAPQAKPEATGKAR